MKYLLMFALFCSVLTAQSLDCSGCGLKLDVNPDEFAEGLSIEVAWNEAKPGSCNKDTCEASACDFSSVDVTVTNDTENKVYVYDQESVEVPAFTSKWCGYKEEKVDCGSGHRVRIYKEDNEQSAMLGIARIYCLPCEAAFMTDGPNPQVIDQGSEH